MKNYTNELIAQIKALALTEIPAWINSQNGKVDEKSYYEKRVQLNTLVVQALTGCEIKPAKKGGYKAHFNKALPTTAQIHEIAAIIDAYTKAVEVTPATEDDDAAIPHTPLGIIDKCNNKKLKAAITGAGSITGEFIDAVDCVAIAAMGAEARRRRNIKLAAIIVGSTVLVAAGVTVGVVMYNKKKDAENDEEFDAEFEDAEEETPSVDVSTLAADII